MAASRISRFQPVLLAGLFAVATGIHASDSPISLVRAGLPHDALYDITFVGQSGVAVGAHGALATSNDGGKTWSSSEPVSELALLGVAASSNRLLIVGQQGEIFAGPDPQRLRRVESPTEERLFSVAFNEDGLAVAVGGFGTVLVSKDYGSSWQQEFLDWGELHPEGLEAHLYDVSINAAGEILICGEFAMILSSRNQGKTWRVRHRGDASLFAMYIDDSGTGLAVGQDGSILRTTNGGRKWRSIDTEGAANLLDVWHSEHGEAVAIGIRAMWRSSDAGKSWAEIDGRSI